ncbi:DUF881 domain-containing protein [Lysinibacillus sp. 54212]|uniref:DUF881 domain-containing protein n=1 Tax=Lysinibacillus sp. 54212 TaxID=3119829 RepID=UPI002FC5CD57
MTKKSNLYITIISCIIGFMLAVQYNSVQSPTEQNNLDVWEIRQDLSDEKKRHSELLEEIQKTNEIVRQYEDEKFNNPEALLGQTLEQLKMQAGLKEVTGPGIVLTLKPSFDSVLYGYEINEIPPSLLIRLVNDIYRFNGQYIEIDGQRLIHTTAIRDINGKTTVNSVPIGKSNVEIKVITNAQDEAEKLYNHLLASSFMDEFFIDNIELTIGEPQSDLEIAATDKKLMNTYLNENNKGD